MICEVNLRSCFLYLGGKKRSWVWAGSGIDRQNVLRKCLVEFKALNHFFSISYSEQTVSVCLWQTGAIFPQKCRCGVWNSHRCSHSGSMKISWIHQLPKFQVYFIFLYKKIVRVLMCRCIPIHVQCVCRCIQKFWNGGLPCFCAYQWVPIAEFYVFNSKIVITIVPSMTSVSSESYYLTALIILPNKRCPKHTNEQRFKQRKSTLTQSYDVLSTYLDNT